jgi:hypothetical protein
MVKEIFIQRNGPGACGAAQTRFDHLEFEHLLVDVLDTGRPNYPAVKLRLAPIHKRPRDTIFADPSVMKRSRLLEGAGGCWQRPTKREAQRPHRDHSSRGAPRRGQVVTGC